MKTFNCKSLVSALIISVLPLVSNAQLKNPINIPLNFYGRVLDQDAKPVTGARVNLESQANYFDEDRSEQKKFQVETDKDGNFVLQPQFDDADDFYEGFARVTSNGQWSYIDKTGKQIWSQ